MHDTIFNIPIPKENKKHILEEIIKYISHPKGYFHVISLNTEILVLTKENKKFREVVKWGKIRIIDGVGVYIAARISNIHVQERIAGVELMEDLLKLAHERRLRIMLIGGGAKVAERVIECQSRKYGEAKFYAVQGIKNIHNPKKEEEKKIFSIVADIKPHIIFAAFGSPHQELWLYKNREKFSSNICMGVGGAFDFLSQSVPRAPLIMRKYGLEWLFRLILQPWRLKRQFKLIKFWLYFADERLRSLFLSNSKERKDSL